MAGLAGVVALLSIIISVMTGERINLLIWACGGMLARLAWKPKWHRYLGLVAIEILAILLIFSTLPRTSMRYTNDFIVSATTIETSVWLHTVNSGIIIARDNLLFGIGPGNFRYL